MSGGRYLLDSHVLVWLDKGDARLPASALSALDLAEEIYLSAATAWELGIKMAIGRLELASSIPEMMQQYRMKELPVTIRDGEFAARLPLHHRDPFDRILVAQAMLEGLVLVSADEKLPQYGVAMLKL